MVKYATLLLLAAGLLMAGCKRDDGAPPRAEKYDPAKDTPASTVSDYVDPALSADQVELSAEIKRRKAAPAIGEELPPGATTAPASRPQTGTAPSTEPAAPATQPGAPLPDATTQPAVPAPATPAIPAVEPAPATAPGGAAPGGAAPGGAAPGGPGEFDLPGAAPGGAAPAPKTDPPAPQ